MVGLRNQALPTRACVVLLHQSVILYAFKILKNNIFRVYELSTDLK